MRGLSLRCSEIQWFTCTAQFLILAASPKHKMIKGKSNQQQVPIFMEKYEKFSRNHQNSALSGALEMMKTPNFHLQNSGLFGS